MFPQQVVIDLPSRQINDFLKKNEQKEIELLARPGTDCAGVCFAPSSVGFLGLLVSLIAATSEETLDPQSSWTKTAWGRVELSEDPPSETPSS